MPTYYKYQNPSEIGAAPTLDWGSVISNVNENLQRQEQQRYDNREADKKLANDVLTEINNISQSSDPNLGALIQNHAADIKNNAFNRLKLVQEGKDSRSNYKIFQQNTSASISSMDKFVKNWEPTYKAMMELRAKGLTTKMADAAQDQYGGFQNFKNKKLIQNQNDGFTYTVDIDPETNAPRNGAFGILPFETLNNVKNFTDLKVNLTEKAASFTDKMKPFITVKMKNGVRTLETPDQIKNKNYAEFLENAFNSVAFNDNVIGDILTNYSDWKPNLTDYKESSPTDRVVAGKIEGGNLVSDITPAMRDEAKKIFEKQLLSQVKYEETPRAEFATQRAAGGGEGKGPKPEEVVSAGKVIPMYGQKTNKLAGPAFNISNVRISQGPGITQEIKSVALRNGQVVINGYNVVGKTTGSGVDFEKGTATETKRTKFTSTPIINGKRTKAEGLWETVNGAQMEDIITRVPIPGRPGETFQSLDQAREFLIEEQKRFSSTKPVAGSKETKINNEDQQAIDWLNANPNAPQASAIRKTLKSKGLIK
jgi:hypothetical protein